MGVDFDLGSNLAMVFDVALALDMDSCSNLNVDLH